MAFDTRQAIATFQAVHRRETARLAGERDKLKLGILRDLVQEVEEAAGFVASLVVVLVDVENRSLERAGERGEATTPNALMPAWLSGILSKASADQEAVARSLASAQDAAFALMYLSAAQAITYDNDRAVEAALKSLMESGQDFLMEPLTPVVVAVVRATRAAATATSERRGHAQAYVSDLEATRDACHDWCEAANDFADGCRALGRMRGQE